jgi:hypothetical protein
MWLGSSWEEDDGDGSGSGSGSGSAGKSGALFDDVERSLYLKGRKEGRKQLGGNQTSELKVKSKGVDQGQS